MEIIKSLYNKIEVYEFLAKISLEVIRKWKKQFKDSLKPKIKIDPSKVEELRMENYLKSISYPKFY